MTNVFTYGTLMNPKVVRNIVKADSESVEGTLEGWARKRVDGAIYPGIKRQQGSKISGVLWLNVTD